MAASVQRTSWAVVQLVAPLVLLVAHSVAPLVLLVAHGVAIAKALDNGVGLVPPMGYNTWYDWGCNLDEKQLEDTIRAMEERGLIELGSVATVCV
jgi:hypothetical protein